MKHNKFLLIASIFSAAITMALYSFKLRQQSLIFQKGNSYEKDWAIVDSLTQKGLTQSALERVKRIYTKAKTDKNAAQIVKSVIHRMKFETNIEENAYEKFIPELSKEIAGAQYPLKPILHSITAEVYWQYYQNNRWKLYDRTQTSNFQNDDISTWDANKLIHKVIEHYRFSLKSSDSLKQTPLDSFDDIIMKEPGSRKLRPTLYDFLAHRAVDFYINEEPDIIKPAYTFQLDDEKYFRNYNDFVKIQINSKDSLSLKFHAISILKDIIAFHVQDKDPEALIDADLKRLKFVHNYSTLEKRDSIYLNSLSRLEQQFMNVPSSTEISYQIATIYFEKGENYNRHRSEAFRWEKEQALEICESAIQRYPESFGAKNCKSLIARIRDKALEFTVETVNLPDEPFRALVSYKNVNKIYIRVANLNIDQYNKVRSSYGDKLVEEYLSFPAIKEWSIDLKDENDYQQHEVEIKIPELPLGYYVILAGPDKDFNYKNNGVAYTSCWVSNISYVQRRMEDGSYDFYVFNRKKGTPLKGVDAQLWLSKYNYASRVYETIKGTRYSSNEQGYFNVPATEEYRNFDIAFEYGDDRLHTENNVYQYRGYKEQEQNTKRTFFFTDRAIYRPGQTVYFKGILLEAKGDQNEIKPKTATTVSFYDVNGQKLSSLNLVSNEYGTFQGSFTTPLGALNGEMHISNEYGSVNFSVEEYKRPKFEVKFNPVKGTYKLNEKVDVSGKAGAYAGSSISNAEVKFRIVRTTNFPFPWYRKGYFPASSAMEIANGTTTTNDTGTFFISFKAIPDRNVSKEYVPTYTYTIYADVIDINGETRSSEQQVHVGYTALMIDVAIPDKVNKEGKLLFPVNTTNHAGIFEPSKGVITVFKLKEPEKLLRNRLWEKPDKTSMSKEEFSANFPHDIYNDEDDINKWEKTKIFEIGFDTEKSKEVLLSKLSQQGMYLLEAQAKDKFGEQVIFRKYFTFFDPKHKKTPLITYDWFVSLKDKAEPGERASFLVGSSDEDVKVLCEVEHKGVIVKKEWLNLNKQQKLVEITVEEKHRGNLAVHFVFIKNNRVYQYNASVLVPWTNKNVDFEFETFRDKLSPGQKEEWRIKLKGSKGEKLAAEMVASLYDASLDAFRPHNWYFSIYENYYSQLKWNSAGFGISGSTLVAYNWNTFPSAILRDYERLNWFGFYYGEGYGIQMMDAMPSVRSQAPPENASSGEAGLDQDGSADKKQKQDGAGMPEKETPEQTRENDPPVLRRDFNETAFFYPQLLTDEKGEIIIKFTVPDALTRWKLIGLAHTKDLKLGQVSKELVTQKELMVIPNVPRFFREGDKIVFTAKITNLTNEDLKSTIQLMLFNGITMEPVDEKIGNDRSPQPLEIGKGRNTSAMWELTIPEGIGAITYRILAQSGKHSDGEEMTIPVLTNRMLVTETLPLPVKGNQTKKFTFDKLLNNSSSATLKNHKLSLEFTSNPAWYAIQALPYLMEHRYDCSEHVFSRFYANSIASHIANSKPKIKAVFESWKNKNSDALVSNLEKNQELKTALLEETPWVLEAKDESERKKRLGLLFDFNRMSAELTTALRQLQKMQLPNGAWPWFDGMQDDRYITQHILAGMGHLDRLGINNLRNNHEIWNMVQEGISYLDERIRDDYEDIMKHYPDKPGENHLSAIQIHYLYVRSFFTDIAIVPDNKKAVDYFKGQAEKYWLKNNRYMQGMIALVFHRDGVKKLSSDIIKSLKENAIHNEEMGMYWKENYGGYYWYEPGIEAQALLIEAFDEITKEEAAVNELKIWLLKSKQTQDWKSTKATTEACYALLLRGSDWLETGPDVEISMGNHQLDPATEKDLQVEAGTGYFKTSWGATEIKPEMGKISITKKNEGISWGAVYWQYFEDLDKITPHETPLKLNKKLFLEKNTFSGPVIEAVTEKTVLQTGDKLKVRIELRVDRNMEYVHMKDMRASGFEPLNVLSGYKYQGGLGYYESTKDISTNFFFNYLPKGTYVFEYPLRVSHHGNFSNGVTSIQCMYAPEFSSHSEGIRVKVGK